MINNQNIAKANIVSSSRMRTILDVLVEWKVVDQTKTISLKDKNNQEVEQFLLKENIADQKIINKAYAVLFNLRYLSLRDQKFELRAIKTIRKDTIKQYRIFPYNIYFNPIKKKQIIQVALGNPGLLKESKQGILHNLRRGSRIETELVITDPEDIDWAINKYFPDENSKLKRIVYKDFVDLRAKTIPKDVLGRFPEDVAKKYDMVVYEAVGNSTIKVAALDPQSKLIKNILGFISERSMLHVELYKTDQESINHCLSQYQGSSGLVLKKPEIAQKETLKSGQITNVIPSQKIIPKSPTKETFEKKEIEEKVKEANFTEEKKQDLDKIFEKKPSQVSDNSIADVFKPFVTDEQEESEPLKPKTELMSPKVEIDKGETLKDIIDSTEIKENENSREKQLQKLQELSGKTSREDSLVKPEVSHDDETANIYNKHLQEDQDHEAQVEEMKKLEEELTLRAETDLSGELEADIKSNEDLKKIIDTATVPKIVAAFINYALFKKASDIHIEPTEKEVRVRFRIDGILYDIISLPRYFRSALVSRIKIMSRLKIDEQRVPQDGRFDVVYGKNKIDIRVSSLPTIFGEKIAMRLLDKSSGVLTLEELGISGSNLKRLENNINKPYGIILATGPTGSGKSTSLYAILKRISNPSVNIITLEDPVEYEVPGVNQCLVRPKIGFSFAEGLRSVLRQDPNVIMVGEIRDSETANLAVQAAMTGHLVLSSLHTNNASGSIPRLINMKVEPFLITSTINAIIAQRLVRRICQHCKQEVKLHVEVENKVKAALENLRGTENLPDDLEFKFWEGKGCSECHMGYSGRMGIYEIMEMSEGIEKIAIENRPASEIEEQARKEGMITMFQDGLLKALRGITTVDEVFRQTKEVTE